MNIAVQLLVLVLGTGSVWAQGGVTLWTNRFNSPGAAWAKAIAVDDESNIFVAGGYETILAHSTNKSYVTVAYSDAGRLLWSNSYRGPAVGYPPYEDNTAYAVAVGKDGRVFVTGGAGTIAYSNSGVPLWTNQNAPGFGIALDANGNIFTTAYVVGSSIKKWDTSRWISLALSPSGVPLWTNYAGLLNRDYARRIAVDPKGNVLVAGTWTWPIDNSELTVIKYSPLGEPLWMKRFGRSGDDFVTGMTVSTNGTVFLTGGLATDGAAPPSFHFLTLALSADGALLWTNCYGGFTKGSGVPAAVTLDRDGNVIVTGGSVGEVANEGDYATIKYSSTGVPLWTNRFRLFGGRSGAQAIAVDSNSNVIVTGSGYSNGSSVYATVMYSKEGALIWTNVHSGWVANGVPQAVAVSDRGYVFVTASKDYDFLTMKLSSSLQPSEKVQNQAVLTWLNPWFNFQSTPLATVSFADIAGARRSYTNRFTFPQPFFTLTGN
jgi:hypothetical protein